MRRILGVLSLLLLWEGFAAMGWANSLYAPPPHEVLLTLWGLLAGGEIWPHLQATFSAALLGLLWGLLLGGALGLLAAFSPLVADLLGPVMLLLNAIPRVILAPLFVIWLGIGLASKVALSLVLVALLIFFAVYGGVRNVDSRLVERVRTLGGGRLWLLREVYLPSLAAWVLSSLKVAVGFAFTGAVVGEFVAASQGLGYLLSFAQSTYNAELSLALIALIVLFVLLLFFLFDRLERHLLRWRPQAREQARG
ncbi:ABC transporter permease [Thermus sediminis]|uniref:ABC transporter permease n=1 Tax=Thermus sediminis TaxID=1761908 RepID=UPI000E3D6CBC|nr:ABC transporter permease subunit [Thermus sediminis]